MSVGLVNFVSYPYSLSIAWCSLCLPVDVVFLTLNFAAINEEYHPIARIHALYESYTDSENSDEYGEDESLCSSSSSSSGSPKTSDEEFDQGKHVSHREGLRKPLEAPVRSKNRRFSRRDQRSNSEFQGVVIEGHDYELENSPSVSATNHMSLDGHSNLVPECVDKDLVLSVDGVGVGVDLQTSSAPPSSALPNAQSFEPSQLSLNEENASIEGLRLSSPRYALCVSFSLFLCYSELEKF